MTIFWLEKKMNVHVSVGRFNNKADAIKRENAMLERRDHGLEYYAQIEIVPIAFDEDGEPCEWAEVEISEDDAYYGAIVFFREDAQFFSVFEETEIEEFIKFADQHGMKDHAVKISGWKEKKNDTL